VTTKCNHRAGEPIPGTAIGTEPLKDLEVTTPGSYRTGELTPGTAIGTCPLNHGDAKCIVRDRTLCFAWKNHLPIFADELEDKVIRWIKVLGDGASAIGIEVNGVRRHHGCVCGKRFGFQVKRFGFQVKRFGFQVKRFGFQVKRFGFVPFSFVL
jgi:hypothetical protein